MRGVILLGPPSCAELVPAGLHTLCIVNRSGEAHETLPTVATVRHAMRYSPDAALLMADTDSVLPGSELEIDVLNALESGLDVYCADPNSLAGRECFRHAAKLTGARFMGTVT